MYTARIGADLGNIKPQFSATYLVSGNQKELERFRNQLRFEMNKKGVAYSTATVKEEPVDQPAISSLMVFTDLDAKTLKDKFAPQRLYNMQLSQYNTMRTKFETTLKSIYERMVRQKSTLIKEELGGDYYKTYADFIDGLAQASMAHKTALAKEMALFDQKFKPLAPQSWSSFVTDTLPQLSRVSVKDVLMARKKEAAQGFDYREGVLFNRAEAAEKKQSLLDRFSVALEGRLSDLKEKERETKHTLLGEVANTLLGLRDQKQSDEESETVSSKDLTGN